ncbi:MAG: PrgI family protein [Erysipelotrichaceae bacterium]|nr:PrgI family protein [Erysipelotrichaceae bacterium]
MEININKDIREYTEGVFFGLNLRQLICSGLAVASAVGVYFYTRNTVSQEVITYLCIAAAAPFAAIGFIRYNGMPMEKIFVAWLKDNILVPRRLTVKSNNIYLEALRDYFARKEKEEINAQKHSDNTQAG